MQIFCGNLDRIPMNDIHGAQHKKFTDEQIEYYRQKTRETNTYTNKYINKQGRSCAKLN